MDQKVGVKFAPWHLRGYSGGAVWNAYVEIIDSHSITQLIEVKQQLNNPPVTGLVLVENSSTAMKRLGPGWKELDNGLWYKVFT